MSGREKRKFIRRLLSTDVRVSGHRCKVKIDDMFTRVNNAVVLVRKRNGNLIAVGVED